MTNKKRVYPILLCLAVWAIAGCGSQTVVVIPGEAGEARLAADRFRPIHLEAYWTNNDLSLAGGEKVEKVWLEPQSIYCLTSLNILYRLDREKGIIAWMKQLADPPRVVRRPVEAGDKTLVIAHNVARIYELESGNLVQELSLNFGVNSDPAFDGERIFVADSVDRVRAIELSSGVEIWSCRAEGTISVQPVLADSLLVAVSESGEVMGYDTQLGRSQWYEHFRTRGAVLSRPVLAGQACYVASTDSMLYCLRNDSGDEMWRYFASRSLQRSPSVADDRVFLSIPGKGLAVLDARDGTELKDFQFADGKQYVGTVDDRLYILLDSGRIVSVDARNGQRLVELGVEDFDFFLGDDTKPHIYLANSKGRIVCLQQLGAGLRE